MVGTWTPSVTEGLIFNDHTFIWYCVTSYKTVTYTDKTKHLHTTEDTDVQLSELKHASFSLSMAVRMYCLSDLRKSWYSEVVTNVNSVYVNLVVFVLLRSFLKIILMKYLIQFRYVIQTCMYTHMLTKYSVSTLTHEKGVKITCFWNCSHPFSLIFPIHSWAVQCLKIIQLLNRWLRNRF